MNNFSESFASSIVKEVKKKCFMNNTSIPSDHLILSLLKLFILSPNMCQKENNESKTKKELVQLIFTFLRTSNYPSIVTLKMQIHFNQNHHDEDLILYFRQEKMTENLYPLQHLILQKSVKSREDYDQLYHHICCFVVLLSGIGDPTDNEILKETIAAVKSILTTKDLARFASKARSLKEKQLQDISRILIGILVYNKNFTKKDDDAGDLVTHVDKALRKCYDFLENKLLELDERILSLIRLFLKFYTSSEVKNSSNLERVSQKLDCESTETGKYIKSYIICMQQYKVYLRISLQIINTLVTNFKLRSDQLQKRLLRVRKTVKFRNAIPVVEIYPQFKDISLSWDKIQEISTLLNNSADIVSYLRKAFEKVSKPQFDVVPDLKKPEKISKFDFKIPVSKNVTENLQSSCEHILPRDDSAFYSLSVEFSDFCTVLFVDTKGILAQGIKEYGLVKYRNAYFCFSSVDAIIKFCLSPETYIEALLQLAFIWPEIINLLQLEKWLIMKKETEITSQGRAERQCLKEASIQTDVHPVLSLKDYMHASNIELISKRISRGTQCKRIQAHAVQTDASTFRLDSSTQTVVSFKKIQ